MKDLLSKEYYCYKIHTSLTKSKAYSPFFRYPPPPEYIWIIPYPPAIQTTLLYGLPPPPSSSFFNTSNYMINEKN